MLGNPLPDAALEKLERLYAAATDGMWWADIHDTSIAPDFPILSDTSKIGLSVGAARIENALAIVALHNAFPALIARLRKAEAERDELAIELGVTRSAVRSPELFQAIHESLAPAARDARIKREGAIEALEEIANLIRQTTPDARSASNVERGKFEGRMYAIEQIESEAAKLREGSNELV